MMNQDLEYLGLSSLKKVYGGHIFVQFNPKLCYVGKMKWQKLFLSRATSQKSFLVGNADETETCSK